MEFNARTRTLTVDLNDFCTESEIFNDFPQEFRKDLAPPREGFTAPIDEYVEMLNVIRSTFSISHPAYIMTLTNLSLGNRLTELNSMDIYGKVHDQFNWDIGKNQRGKRVKKMSKHWWDAIREHRKEYCPRKNKLFSWSAETYRKKFNEDIRPLLNSKWQERVTEHRRKGVCIEPFKYQCKSFRKVYATFLFYKLWDKYGDAAVALVMTQRDLKHNTVNMTAEHYIEEGERINIRKWLKYDWQEIFSPEIQKKLT